MKIKLLIILVALAGCIRIGNDANPLSANEGPNAQAQGNTFSKEEISNVFNAQAKAIQALNQRLEAVEKQAK